MDNNNLNEIIPENRGGMQRIFDLIYWRNFVEGIIAAGINAIIVYYIPFVPKMKIFSMVFFPLAHLIFFFVGIKNKSVTQYIFLWLRAKASKKSLGLRSPADEDSAPITESNETIRKYTVKAKAYFSDDNLNREDNDTKRIVAKGIKKIIVNFKDAFNI